MRAYGERNENNFWVGKITSIMNDKEGVVNLLKVHWYQLHKSVKLLEVK